jgi:hypothetical protein
VIMGVRISLGNRMVAKRMSEPLAEEKSGITSQTKMRQIYSMYLWRSGNEREIRRPLG